MSKKPLAVIILAAGKGTRMKSPLPKVMHHLAGRPMINWLIASVEQLKPQKIVVVVGPDMDDLKKSVAPHETVLQKIQDGTGGAVRSALPALKNFKGDVLVLLGDTPLVSMQSLKNLIAARKNSAIAVLGVELENPAGYGRLITNGNTLEKIVEEKDASSKEKSVKLVNTGVFCIDGEKISGWIGKIGNKNAAREFYLTDLPEIAAKDKANTTVVIADCAKELKGCNSKIDLAALESTLQNRLREDAMKSGVTMIDPSTVYFSFDTKIAPSVLIEPNVFFGPGVEIGDDVHIKAFSHIEGAKIAKNATIGPFARLRPGTQIGEDARIGNFVEIKKSKIGKGSKVSHLGYVGDATLGKDVNFGCGAITVNYDGYQKHETKIGDNVMVGSNASLVAPLIVENGAFIAAGSTITEDVPADSLTIARNVAKVSEGWALEYRKRKGVKKKKS